MKTLATMTAALGLLGALGAANPAAAAMGQCFDAYGRPYGPPHSTDNPPYGKICQAYRVGGHCTGVEPQWVASNCGFRPRGYENRGYYYNDPDGRPDYRSRRYDHERNQPYYPPRYQFSPGMTYPNSPQPNTAR